MGLKKLSKSSVRLVGRCSSEGLATALTVGLASYFSSVKTSTNLDV